MTLATTNFDWPLFGLGPSRANATSRSIGITAGRAARLHRHTVSLPGTVDSSPVYLHGVQIAGARRDVFVMTTTYGKTLALALLQMPIDRPPDLAAMLRPAANP